MRSCRTAVVAAVLGGLAVLGPGAPRAEARGTFVVRKFLLGHLDGNTDRFKATGARGTTNAFRDNVVMLVFSAPVDFDSLTDRTVQIGVPSDPGLRVPAEGSFYRYVVKEFDPVSGTYLPKRTYRNRVVFDPTSWQEPWGGNPDGFRADTSYTVAIPGVDAGVFRTVRSREGASLQSTFTTTFRTTDRFLRDEVWCPEGDTD
jgi:hypothetical protein